MSGEFFVLKSKTYVDNSLALKIPLTDLLDVSVASTGSKTQGTKSSQELKKKYSNKLPKMVQYQVH